MFSGAGNRGIYCTNAGNINAVNADATNAGSYGVYAVSGNINASGVDATGAGTHGFRVYSGGIVNANNASGTLSKTENVITSAGIIFQ